MRARVPRGGNCATSHARWTDGGGSGARAPGREGKQRCAGNCAGGPPRGAGKRGVGGTRPPDSDTPQARPPPDAPPRRGVGRFDYLRLLGRVMRGEADPKEIAESAERFDNHYCDSPAWRAALEASA